MTESRASDCVTMEDLTHRHLAAEAFCKTLDVQHPEKVEACNMPNHLNSWDLEDLSYSWHSDEKAEERVVLARSRVISARTTARP